MSTTMLRLAGLFAALIASSPTQAVQMLTEENPPYNYVENKALVGISTEILVEMGKRANVPMTFSIMAWPQAYDQTQMKPDTCLFSTVRLVNRENLFKWIGPIATNQWGLFAKTGFKGQIAKLADARPYRIGGVTNDAKVMWLRDEALTNIVTVDQNMKVPDLLTLDPKKPGGVDLWITGIAAEKVAASRAKLKDLQLVLKVKEEPLWLACHPSLAATTVKALSDALAAMQKDGTVKKINDTYDSRFAQ